MSLITASEKELKQICADTMMFKNRLAALNLWESVHVMEEVTKKIGWEVAEELTARKKKA